MEMSFQSRRSALPRWRSGLVPAEAVVVQGTSGRPTTRSDRCRRLLLAPIPRARRQTRRSSSSRAAAIRSTAITVPHVVTHRHARLGTTPKAGERHRCSASLDLLRRVDFTPPGELFFGSTASRVTPSNLGASAAVTTAAATAANWVATKARQAAATQLSAAVGAVRASVVHDPVTAPRRVQVNWRAGSSAEQEPSTLTRRPCLGRPARCRARRRSCRKLGYHLLTRRAHEAGVLRRPPPSLLAPAPSTSTKPARRSWPPSRCTTAWFSSRCRFRLVQCRLT